MRLVAASLGGLGGVVGCSDDSGTSTEPLGSTEPIDTGDSATEDASRAQLAYRVGTRVLEPLEEELTCLSMTLDNDEPLYVQEVRLSNGGALHHSNWVVVPESAFPGPDGFWPCRERDFTDTKGAQAGTVLFAQSTQSRLERQRLAHGAVIKIPARHKIISDVHFLNAAPRELETSLDLTLEIVHPAEVEAVMTPLRLTYLDLSIPPGKTSHFSTECDLASAYEGATDSSFDLALHYVLPHYHDLGSHFRLEVVGGPRDGDVLHLVEGFDADANGLVFDPPVDLTGAQGLRLTCGYDNWRNDTVGWGVGDQEMCVMLGLAESKVVLDGFAASGSRIVDAAEGFVQYQAGCLTLTYDKPESQRPPTREELDGPLYVPEVPEEARPDEEGAVCVDAPRDAEPLAEPTLSTIREFIFEPSCTFSACHGAAAAGGLDLSAEDLHGELLEHEVGGGIGLPLIEPGNADGSWLLRVMAQCEPEGADGGRGTSMPANAPELLDPRLVAMVRAWIDAGARDD